MSFMCVVISGSTTSRTKMIFSLFELVEMFLELFVTIFTSCSNFSYLRFVSTFPRAIFANFPFTDSSDFIFGYIELFSALITF